MTTDFGEDVSRVLPADDRQYTQVVWQKERPPLDSELNLVSQIQEEARKNILSSDLPSGWMGDPCCAEDGFEFDRRASNLFWFGGDPANGRAVQWAHVNGWMVPVAGTNTSDLRNKVQLPPPQTGSETDVTFVFLEVWRAIIEPTVTANKPAADKVWKYGNTLYGGTNPDDDLIDPQIQFETTNRVQLQYRIRTARGVDPAAYPHGFNPNVKGQGTKSSQVSNPDSAYEFSNMGDEMGDPGLWRAGTGDPDNSEVETVDGYTYAIPLCFVFRRTDGGWSVVDQHAAYNRNADASDASDADMHPEVKLSGDLSETATTISVDVSNSQTYFESSPSLGSGDDLIRINDEVVQYSSWSGTTIQVASRGARNTHATKHDDGDGLRFVSDHPEGLFSDQIHEDDVLDIRHHVSLSGHDYQSMLDRTFNSLLSGDLRTNWKRGEGNVLGAKTYQVDFVSNTTPPPNDTIQGDKPDGFRKIFSDACALQPSNLIVADADTGTATSSEYGFNPGTVNVYRSDSAGTPQWQAGDVFEVSLDQFRSTFLSANDEKVRFVHPFEYDDASHDPIRMWVDGAGNIPANDRKAISKSDFDPHLTGTHDGSNDSANLVDSNAHFTHRVKGLKVVNSTDGSEGTVTAVVSPTELEVSVTGGSDNDFDTGDAYEIGETGDDPWFVALGSKPEGSLPVSLEADGSTVDFVVGGASNGVSISGEDFSQTHDGQPVGDYLASIDAWIVFKQDQPSNAVNHGAYRILGEFNGGDLLLERAKGSTPTFVDTSATRDWDILLQDVDESDDALHIALHNDDAGGPYSSAGANIGLNFDVLYHPAQGLGRNPEDPLFVQMETTSPAGFLREDDFANYVNSSTATVKRFPSKAMSLYPHRRDTFDVMEQKDPTDSREVAWAEAYVDSGSKTMVFQPWQETDLKASPGTLTAAKSYLASGGTDATGRFNLDSGDNYFELPEEVFPPPGRMDLPFVQSQDSNKSVPGYGLNFLFRSSEADADKVVSGINDSPLYLVYDPSQFSDADWGKYVDLGNYNGPAGKKALVCRPYEKQGRHIGVELPTHYGIARLFGIYSLSEFDSNSGASGFGSDQRVEQGIYTNLLREDAERRSLMLTTDNTFVIPDDAIDTKVLGTNLGGADCHTQNGTPLVFETGLFMFEDATTDFVQVHATTATTSQDLPLYVNGPADVTESVYQVSTRRPYQGDIAQTMPASGSNPGSLSPEDYSHKHGVETPSEVGDAFQTDLNLHDVRDPNAVNVEVLASRTFATTLGTGMISGPVVSGSYTDVGHLSMSGYPYTSNSDPARSAEPRAMPVDPLPNGTGNPVSSAVSSAEAGVSEQLPMGILYGDYALLGEPMFEDQKRFWNPDLVEGGIDTHWGDGPATGLGRGGEIVFSDGTALGGSSRAGFDATLDLYRTYRGGVVRLTGEKSDVSLRGGEAHKDLSRLSDVSDRDRLMHGAVLVGAALLVRDSSQEITTNNHAFSFGGEIQMLVLTGVVQGQEALNSLNHDYEVVDLLLKMHTRGLGEGRAAADRYRVKGRPLDIAAPEAAPSLDNDALLDE